MLRLLTSTRSRRMRRDTRGTTMVEYGLLLFVVLVICAVGLKVLGITLQRKFGQADQHMAGNGQGQTTSSGAPATPNNSDPNFGGKGVAKQGEAARPPPDAIHKDPTNSTGGGGGDTGNAGPQGLPAIARFALLALGVLGTVAAFFAMKTKKTG